MKQSRLLAVCLAALATAHCHQSPSAPTATALIVPASVTVAHNDSSTVTAQLQKSNGQTEDVTATAVWTSSAPGVVTAQAGVLKAVGVGTATVTVTHSGLSATIAVLARRITRLTSQITVEETRSRPLIHGVEAYLDTRVVYSLSFSGAERAVVLDLSAQPATGSTYVLPGSVRLSVRVTPDPILTEASFSSRPESYVDVRDSETGELLERIPLSMQTVFRPDGSRDPVELVWSLSIGTYH